MKLFCTFSLFIWCVYANSQQYIFDNLQDLVAENCNEVDGLVIEKRNKNQLTLNGGADFKIFKPNSESMSEYLKKHCYAVKSDSSLYVNCKHLRYKRLRFGNWYAAAMIINGNVFFCAMPLGSAISRSMKTLQVTLGGKLGDALASSVLVHKRVYYMIDGTQGHVIFVGRDCMNDLLGDHPELLQAYTEEDSELAATTQKYLLALSEKSK